MLGHFSKQFLIHDHARKALCLLQIVAWPTLIVMAVGAAGLRLNLTHSVPIGLYRITADSASDLVEFCPPEPFGSLSVQRGYRPRSLACADYGEPLLKPVVARDGDVVRISAEGFSVNGVSIPNTAARVKDSAGRAIAPWPFGVYRVEPDTVWVASSYNAKSFDSRYFGPVTLTNITHHLRAVWTVP
jgi:conjugative transfer signal peptidase TraF